MIPAVIAALCMVATDLVGTVQVQAEARDRGWIAGWCDVFGWLASIATTALTVNVLISHSTLAQKAWMIGLVSAANLFGTRYGVLLGDRILKNKTLALIASARSR